MSRTRTVQFEKPVDEAQYEAKWQEHRDKSVRDLSASWASQAVGAKVVEFEKHLRVMCGYCFRHGDGFTAAQSEQFHVILKSVGDVLVEHASGAAFDAVARSNVLHYITFCALRCKKAAHTTTQDPRTKDGYDKLTKSRDPLDGVWCLLQTVVALLQMDDQRLGNGRGYIIDLLINLVCGKELPLDIPARLQSQYFMRSEAWEKAGSQPDLIDEMWRSSGSPGENHFSAATFTYFQPLLKVCLDEQWDVVLQRQVRGKRYIESLINASNSLFRFYQGNSVAAQRTAVGHATSAVATNAKEVLLALGDLEFPKYIVSSLGSHDEPLVASCLKILRAGRVRAARQRRAFVERVQEETRHRAAHEIPHAPLLPRCRFIIPLPPQSRLQRADAVRGRARVVGGRGEREQDQPQPPCAPSTASAPPSPRSVPILEQMLKK